MVYHRHQVGDAARELAVKRWYRTYNILDTTPGSVGDIPTLEFKSPGAAARGGRRTVRAETYCEGLHTSKQTPREQDCDEPTVDATLEALAPEICKRASGCETGVRMTTVESDQGLELFMDTRHKRCGIVAGTGAGLMFLRSRGRYQAADTSKENEAFPERYGLLASVKDMEALSNDLPKILEACAAP